MSHLKVLSAVCSPLTDMLGPLPREEDLIYPQLEEPWGDAVTRAVLRNRLEDRIKNPYSDTLVLPPTLLDQLTQDVLTIAKDEPCGLRGCVLKVTLSAEAAESKEEKVLAQVKADITTPTTHELHVTLQSDSASWLTKMTKYFRSLSKRKIVISPKYELKKVKAIYFEE